MGTTFEDDGLYWEEGCNITLDYCPSAQSCTYSIESYYDDEADKYFVVCQKEVWIGQDEDDDDDDAYERTILKSAYLDTASDVFRTIAEYIDYVKSLGI